MNLVRGVQICTSLDNSLYVVEFSFEGSTLMTIVGKVSFVALSYGSLEVIACLCFCSSNTEDGQVVIVVPFGIH